ncbi:hypothetical protein MY04_5276 [Flammeovirga sp. MY04]|uniref:hypothetical protein n=1 Tax=Flammeovirga sp. MY04 TaxID=1191459 RepID=UPI00080636F7|nr:hypothetical protein [Flammeovirga sp. MY04]ANQ52608.1 hypothetical protein MY04_5276 [Flammeovirga sp. MY04]
MKNKIIILILFLLSLKVHAQINQTFYVAKIDIYVTIEQKKIKETLSDINEALVYFPLSCLYYKIQNDTLLVSDERLIKSQLTNNVAVLMIAEYKGKTEDYVNNSMFASFFHGYIEKKCYKKDFGCSEQAYLQSYISNENLFLITKEGKVKNLNKGEFIEDGKGKFRLTYNGSDPNLGKYKEEFLVSFQKIHHIKLISHANPCY